MFSLTAQIRMFMTIVILTVPAIPAGAGTPGPLPCQPDQNCQLFGDIQAFFSTPGKALSADDFTPAADGAITQLCWQGGAIYADPNNPPPDSFTVSYFEDDKGKPGTMIAEFSESAGTLTNIMKQDTNADIFVFDIFQYTAEHPGVDVFTGTCYWVEISNDIDLSSWFWSMANPGEGNERSFVDGFPLDGYRPEDVAPVDLAFCLPMALSEPACGIRTIFSTGPERTVLADLTGSCLEAFLPLSSGNLEPLVPGATERWTAQAFTVPEVPGGGPSWRITLITADGYTPGGVANEFLSFIVWNRTGLSEGSAPVDGDQVVEGSTPFPDLTFDNPEGGAADSVHAIWTNFDLAPGDYWLTVYAGNSNPGLEVSDFAWFLNPETGINNLDNMGNAFIWRSQSFPDPGFELVQFDRAFLCEVNPDLHNTSFEIHGSPNPNACPWDCDSAGSTDGTVGIVDFLALLAQWGGPGSCDFDGGGVGIVDFLELLAHWGPCP